MFFTNLENIYAWQNYDAHRIWNVDESGAQVATIVELGCLQKLQDKYTNEFLMRESTYLCSLTSM